MCDDLQSALREAATAARPSETPPFAGLERRRRGRQLRTMLAVSSGLVIVAGAAVTITHDGSAAGRQSPLGTRQDRLHSADGAARALGGTPSPFPDPRSGLNHQKYEATPNICDSPPGTDDEGRINKAASYDSGQAILRPPGTATSNVTRQQVLDRFATGGYTSGKGHVVAYFGLLSAGTPSRTNADGTTWFKYDNTPTWVVVRCDGEANAMHGGPAIPEPPAPGTAPSPGPPTYGVTLALYDINGTGDSVELTGRASPELLASRYITAPWTRTQEDSADGRQIGIEYPGTGACATFDHLSVDELDGGRVNVQVWLRLLDADAQTCPTDGTVHTAVVGLRRALNERAFVDLENE